MCTYVYTNSRKTASVLQTVDRRGKLMRCLLIILLGNEKHFQERYSFLSTFKEKSNDPHVLLKIL